MASIPFEVLEKIENQRPDLARMIHDLMATSDPALATILEKRLADAYLSAASGLTAEETHYLAACRSGRRYADVARSSLH